MSAKELRRGEVLSRVKRGELKLTEAAELLHARVVGTTSYVTDAL